MSSALTVREGKLVVKDLAVDAKRDATVEQLKVIADNKVVLLGELQDIVMYCGSLHSAVTSVTVIVAARKA